MASSNGLGNNASYLEGSGTYQNQNEDSNTKLGLKESNTDFADGIYRYEIAYMISRSYLEGPDKYLSPYRPADVPPSGVEGLHFTSAKDNDDIKILLLCTSPLLWSHKSAVILVDVTKMDVFASHMHLKSLNILLFSSRSYYLFHMMHPYQFAVLWWINTFNLLTRINVVNLICFLLSNLKVIVHLIRKLDYIRVPAARGMIIWMVGEYYDIGPVIHKVLPVVRKYLARCFSTEDIETKLQILNSCTKVLLHAKEEELGASRKLLNYLLDLARCDLNYDICDCARLMKELLSCHIGSHDAEESGESQQEIREGSHLLAESVFGGKIKATSPEPFNARFYLPGSLSHVVLHAAPGYEPLPRPYSLNYEGFDSNTLWGIKVSGDGATQSELDTDHPDSASGSLNEESTSDYSYKDSVDSDSNSGSNTDGSFSENGNNTGQLIHLSDAGNPSESQNGCSQLDNSYSGSNNLEELISGRSLESWLDENPSSSHNLSESCDTKRSSAKISIGDISGRVKHKIHTLLDSSYSNGLALDYVFLSEASILSPLLLCLRVSFENCSTEPMSSVQLVEDDKNCDYPDHA